MPEEPKNSFKQLEKLQEKEYEENLSKVKKKVDGNINSISSIMNVIDIYFSKVIGYFISKSGGTSGLIEDEDPDTKD